MSGWLNFNESLSSIKGQISTFASNVLADDEGTEANVTSNEDFKKLCLQKDLEIEHLKKINGELEKSLRISKQRNEEPNDNNWDWRPQELTIQATDPTDDISHLKETIRELENEKNDLLNQLEQLDLENQQNLSELVRIREKLQDEKNELKDSNSQLKLQNKALISKEKLLKEELAELRNHLESKTENATKIKLEELESELSTHETLNKTDEKEIAELTEKLEKSESEKRIVYNELHKAKEIIESAEAKSQEDAENCQRLEYILETYEKEVSSLKEKLANNNHENKLEEIAKLKSSLQEKTIELETKHNMYINIITENIKRYIDSDVLPWEHPHTSDDPHVTEFSRQVENIFKILQEFKQKCETLEKDLIEASNEKTNILNEKYNEIEKLIQNSEVLSQELIKKGDKIKELESELSNLITTNDVLLSELDSYKNPSGLQTISESNEDNIVSLETDLENANKRIMELEGIIDDTPTTSHKLEDYQILLNNFDALRIDYDELTCKLEHLSDVERENDKLKAQLDKLKADFENTDYQLSEANFTIESLKELKSTFDNLQLENKKLKLQSMNSIDLKSELNDVKEKWLSEEILRRDLEAQVKNLTEKQQNAKMSETSLKLQFDTLSKEYASLAEAKSGLEQSLSSAKASLEDYERNYSELLQKYDEVLLRCEELNGSLHEKEHEILRLKCFEEGNQNLEKTVSELTVQLQEKEKDIEMINQKLNERKIELEQLTLQQKEEIETYVNKEVALQERIRNLEQSSTSKAGKGQRLEEQHLETIASLRQQIQDLANSRNELINMITIKHQESLNYHNEIQRLSDILKKESQKSALLESKLVQASDASVEIAKKNEEIDKLCGENSFLKEKCDVLTKNLLELQQTGPSEKELSLSKQLERLQSHLMELEERYTLELLQAEQKNAELQAKVADLEQREKNSSTMYTSVSIRANQQVETLQKQLQMVTNQREELRKKISDAEDLNVKQAAALANLQFVLDQFQKDKEKDVQKETERIRRQINVERQVQDDLRNEIDSLKAQLEESRIGLQAASRLSDQLELLKKQNSGLKDEVSKLQQKLSKCQQTINELTSQTDGKIDKSLIKNLIVGFLSSCNANNNNWNKDQTQVLKLIATVLDFNQQDHDKVNLNRQQHGSWLGSLLFPHPNNQNLSQESLSQAFVKFLENESRPRVVPSLLGEQSSRQGSSTENSSKMSTPRASPSPIILNEVVLPTFADFGQSRNSSSILKDVLKDNNG